MPSSITILPNEPIGFIRPELYGHFAEHLGACVEDGLWVGEDSVIANVAGLRRDVLEALRRIHVPVLRWPGGCYADDYHWEDGVGPHDARPRRVNIWWGQNIERNGFGTHEFIQACRFIGAEPYLAGNVGSGSPREMRDWVEYCNFNGDSTLARRRAGNGSGQPFGVRYWGVGNENWSCGGNFCPEDYAAEYKRFATYLRDFSGTKLTLIACGPDGNNHDWTRRFFARLGRNFPHIHGYAAHYYCGTAGASSTDFDTNQWYELLEKALRIERLITEQRLLMDESDPDRKIGLVIDEWGTWHLPTPGATMLWQQNTLRDALVAAITLDAFNRHADKLLMANIAQVANVLQAMVLTQGEKMLTTPTYHVFDLYQSHQGGQSLRTAVDAPPVRFADGDKKAELPGLLVSASIKHGTLTLTVVNPHATLPTEARIGFAGDAMPGNPFANAAATVLTHEDLAAHNTFEEPGVLRPAPTPVQSDGPSLRHTFPPASVTRIVSTP